MKHEDYHDMQLEFRRNLIESTQRYAEIYMASDRNWYLALGNEEYADEDDSTTYGPFNSPDAAHNYMNRFSNPGSWDEDPSGKRPAPKKSGDGGRVQRPMRGGGWK